MTGKNIRKALDAKLRDWIKHIDDAEIRETIRNNAIITGGAIVSMLTGEEIHDYDVYFRTKKACYKVAAYYAQKFNEQHSQTVRIEEIENDRIRCFISSEGVAAEEGENGVTDESEPQAVNQDISASNTEQKERYRPVFFSTNAITLSDKIQIVVRFYGEPEQIHENYDFVHCTCSWSSWDNKLSLPARALEAIINKELYYVGSKYPLCSIIRARKFISRGWTINAGQYLKMALQLNELNLKNLEVFEEQLAGVDSAYFSSAVNAIKQKKEKEPDFEVDNEYLFEVINRIF